MTYRQFDRYPFWEAVSENNYLLVNVLRNSDKVEIF